MSQLKAPHLVRAIQKLATLMAVADPGERHDTCRGIVLGLLCVLATLEPHQARELAQAYRMEEDFMIFLGVMASANQG